MVRSVPKTGNTGVGAGLDGVDPAFVEALLGSNSEQARYIKSLHEQKTRLETSEPGWMDEIHRTCPPEGLLKAGRGAMRGKLIVDGLGNNPNPAGLLQGLADFYREKGLSEDWVWHGIIGAPMGTLRAIEAVRDSGVANMITEADKVVDAVRVIGGNPLATGDEIADWLRKNGCTRGIAGGSYMTLFTYARPKDLQKDGKGSRVSGMTVEMEACAAPDLPVEPMDLEGIDLGGTVQAIMATGVDFYEAFAQVERGFPKDGLKALPRATLVDLAALELRSAANARTKPNHSEPFNDSLSRLWAIDRTIAAEAFESLNGVSVPFEIVRLVEGITRIPDGFEAQGILAGTTLREIGENVKAEILILDRSAVREIPPSLRVSEKLTGSDCRYLEQIHLEVEVEGECTFARCPNLKALPKHIRAGSIDFSGCDGLERVAGTFEATGEAGKLDFSGCLSMEEASGAWTAKNISCGGCMNLASLPGRVACDTLWLEGCSELPELPEHLSLAEDLSMEGCVSWDGYIPEGSVKGRIFEDEHPCNFGPGPWGSHVHHAAARQGGTPAERWRNPFDEEC